MKSPAHWEFEYKYVEAGKARIIGIDEVGRGAWAGPMVAVAYSFFTIPEQIVLYDSKITTEKQRITLDAELHTLGDFGIGEVSPDEIDELGLQAAQYLAYNRALAQLPFTPEIVLVDGRPWYSCVYPHEAIIDGDAKVASIAAAAVIAKVHRDTYMKTTLHEQFPNYKFNDHVGYGTKSHQEAIKQFGVLEVHRKSYKPIQKLITVSPSTQNS